VADKVAVYISRELYEKAEKFVKEQGGFSGVDELVEYLLREILEEGGGETGFSREDEEKVKERLRALGYI